MQPWVNTDKSGLSSVGAALSARAFVLDRVVPPLQGSINVFLRLTQGLRPGLCRSIALAGLIEDWSNFLSIICRSNHWIYCSMWLFAFVVGFIGLCRSVVPVALIMRLDFDVVALLNFLYFEFLTNFVELKGQFMPV